MGVGRPLKILMYSHDTYGLGHIRRTLAIAKSVRSIPANILILTGSPLVGRFAIPQNVDFVRIPGMIKITNEEYLPLSMKLDATQVLKIREAIILATARSFLPDYFVVDKAPLGLKKEVVQTLGWIKRCLKSCKTVLGLRDIMDDAEETIREWRDKDVYGAMRELYDEIWVYGVREYYDPIKEYKISDDISQKVYFTGYIPRYVPTRNDIAKVRREIGINTQKPIVLVTTGGGGDGYPIINTFLKAFESEQDAGAHFIALLVTGPFLGTAKFAEIERRASRLGWITIRFHRLMEAVIGLSDVVISMGGYNTVCEIFSQRKPCIIVPRTVPRKEQLIRAQILARLGFCEFIRPDELSPMVLRKVLLRMLEERRFKARLMEDFPFTAFEIIRERLVLGHREAQVEC